MEGLKKRGRDEADCYSADVKRLRENLLDAPDDEAEPCAEIQDLDSFIKSFEEEISGEAINSGESLPDLGYLLEASDDELGLPPTTSSSVRLSELDRFDSSGEFWGDDSLGFGLGELSTGYEDEYVALDGLFDYSGLGFGPSDFEYRHGTLPAQ